MKFARVFATHPGMVVAGVAALAALIVLSGVGFAGSLLAATRNPVPVVTAAATRAPTATRTPSSTATAPAATPTPRDTTPTGGPTGPFAPLPPPVTGDDGHEETSAGAVADCARDAAAFGADYATRLGDTRDAWAVRVGQHVTQEVAAGLSTSLVWDSGQLPAGRPVDVSVAVDSGVCTARVEYERGDVASPTLEAGRSGWLVTAMPRFDVPGGQQAPRVRITAPGGGS